MEKKTSRQKRTLLLVQFSILLAIEAVVCLTPLGSLPAIGPIVATLAAIPVIITAIILGTGWGALMGFFFGLFSFVVWTFMPPGPAAFVFTPFYSVGSVSGNFWSLVICFVPRVLIGVVTGLFYNLFKRVLKSSKSTDIVTFGLSGFLGSMTNTLLVLGGIYIFFGEPYAAEYGMAFTVLLSAIAGIVLTNGIPEAVLGALAAYFIGRTVIKYQRLESQN